LEKTDEEQKQKAGAAKTAAGFFERRSKGATGDALRRFLEGVPDRGPDLEEQSG